MMQSMQKSDPSMEVRRKIAPKRHQNHTNLQSIAILITAVVFLLLNDPYAYFELLLIHSFSDLIDSQYCNNFFVYEKVYCITITN